MTRPTDTGFAAGVRADIFAVLRRHEVSEQCFAEVAMITHAALAAKPEVLDAGLAENIAKQIAPWAHNATGKWKIDGSLPTWEQIGSVYQEYYRVFVEKVLALSTTPAKPSAPVEGLVEQIAALANEDWYQPGAHPILPVAADQWQSRARTKLREAAEALSRLSADLEGMREALTPSGETKAAYIGEFQFNFPVTGPDGEEVVMTPNVPWTTIKEIMAAIRARAALPPMKGEGE